jgi:hypothetical protein
MKHGSGRMPNEQGCQHKCKCKADNNVLFIAELRLYVSPQPRSIFAVWVQKKLK